MSRWLERSHDEGRLWVEDLWRIGPFYAVHWQNLRTPGTASVSSPRHVWKLMVRGSTLQLLVRYGLAPYARRGAEAG